MNYQIAKVFFNTLYILLIMGIIALLAAMIANFISGGDE